MKKSPNEKRRYGVTKLGTASFILAGLLLRPILSGAAAGDLFEMNIEELMKIEVYSVSKKAENLSGTASAIYVISGEDMRRSGHTSIANALRMVPGLHVAKINSSDWAITSRGFNGLFAQKLLVMIDGRSVYSPFHSGVNWIEQDTFPDDIDRIEVIRGPGGTMWGANAVNGVINIITKKTAQTSGLLAYAGGGDEEKAMGGVRYGGRIGGDTSYRVFVKYNDRDGMVDSAGEDLADEWDSKRGGFRIDSRLSASDSLTLEGETYDNNADYETKGMFSPREITASQDDGGHILGRWNHSGPDGSRTELQLYFDSFTIEEPTYVQKIETIDLELGRHEPLMAGLHEISWGGGARTIKFESEMTPTVQLDPKSKREDKYSVYLQDKIALISERLYWTLGSKYEHNDYTGSEYEPSTRIIWTPADNHTLWAAISRAVRTPGRVDYDMTVNLGIGTVKPNRQLQSEMMKAYEIGYRNMRSESLSLDMAVFYHDYWDLHTMEESGSPFPPPGNYEITEANKMSGRSYGLELAANWDAADRWRLKGGYSFIDIDVELDPVSTDPDAVSLYEKGTPRHQAQIISYLDLSHNLQFDLGLYYVGRLEYMDVPSYVKTDMRLGWRPSERLDVSLAVNNVFDRRHGEYFPVRGNTIYEEVERSAWLKLTWRD